MNKLIFASLVALAMVVTSPAVSLAQVDPNSAEIQCGDGMQPDSSGVLCVPTNPFPADSPAGSTSLTELIARVVKFLLYFAGIIAVLFVIIGGYQILTSGGNTEKAGQGKKTLTYAIIGLVVIVLSYTVISVLTNQLTNRS